VDLYKAGIHIMHCCECGGTIMPGDTLYGKPIGQDRVGEDQFLPWCTDCGNKWVAKKPWLG
jgi:hypothetical protein